MARKSVASAEGQSAKDVRVKLEGRPEDIPEASARMVSSARRAAKEIVDGDHGSQFRDEDVNPPPQYPINKLLQVAAYSARATRISPRPGTSIVDPATGRPGRLVSSVDIPLPTTRSEIEDQISQEYGGRSWNIEIRNENGIKVGGFKLGLGDEPRPVFDQPTTAMPAWGMQYPGGMDPRLLAMYSQGDEDEEDPKKLLEREKAMLEIREMRDRAEERAEERERRRSGVAPQHEISEAVNSIRGELGQLKSSMETSIRDIRDALKDASHSREKEDMRAKGETDSRINALKSDLTRVESAVQAGIGEIKTMLLNQPKNDGVMTVLGEMSKAQAKASGDTMNTVMGLLGAKAESNDVVTMFEKFANITGMGGPKDSTTTIMEGVVGGVRETLPEVLSYMTKRAEAGQALSKEGIQEAIDNAVKKLIPMISKTIATAGTAKKNPALPAPKTPPAGKMEKTEVAPAEPQSAGDSGKSQVPQVNVDESNKLRVNEMLKVLLSEIEVMPNEATWVEFAIAHLGRKVLRQVIEAKDDHLKIIEILSRYADADLMAALTAKVLEDPEKQEWILDQFAALADEMNPGAEDESGSGVRVP